MMDLAGKTALVTGGAKRLGRACALGLAEQGAHVVVHYGSSKEEAEETCGAIRSMGRSAWALQADFTAPQGAADLLPCAIELAGPISVLVNSAAIFPESHLRNFTPEQVYENINTNALAPALIARAFAAQGIESVIVNFLDTRIEDYDERHAAYHLSKRMLYTLTRMMAVEFAPLVRVNAVAPGLILPPPGKDESYLAELAHTNPLERYGDPSHIVEAVLFLVRNDFVTGQVVFVDGGRHLKGKMYG
jgi:pteridine reductase